MATTKFYTTGLMRKCFVDSVTSAATNHPKEYLIDDNLDTYWKGTTVNQQDIIIDAGELIAVDAFCIWVHNYTTTFGTAYFKIHYSDTTGPYSWTELSSDAHLIPDTTTPIRIKELTSTTTKQYWKIEIQPVSNVIELSGIWLCNLQTLNRSTTYPVVNNDRYFNNIRRSSGGRANISGVNSKAVREFTRKYLLFDSDIDVMGGGSGMHDDVRGTRHFMFFQEGSSQADAFLVRQLIDDFPMPEIKFQAYSIERKFQTIPYIPPGETY